MTPTRPKPAIVAILAGGKATRFNGQDKGKVLIKGERLIDIIHCRLKPQADEIIISATHDYGLGIKCINDRDDAPGGPVGGLYSIWADLKARPVEGFFTAAIDGPNVPSDLISKLYTETSSAIATDKQGLHPTYAWWRMEDLLNIWKSSDMKSSLSLKGLAEITRAKVVVWDGAETFININRPNDLERFTKNSWPSPIKVVHFKS